MCTEASIYLSVWDHWGAAEGLAPAWGLGRLGALTAASTRDTVRECARLVWSTASEGTWVMRGTGQGTKTTHKAARGFDLYQIPPLSRSWAVPACTVPHLPIMSTPRKWHVVAAPAKRSRGSAGHIRP